MHRRITIVALICAAPAGAVPPDGDKATIFAPGDAARAAAERAPERPWGAPRTDAKTEQLVMEALRAAAAGPKRADKLYDEAVVVGPALYARLRESDSGFPPSKDAESFGVHRGVEITFHAMATLKEKDRQGFLASKAWRELARRIATGKARAATSDERKTYYEQVPFELIDEPVVAVEQGGDALIMTLVEGKVLWIEMVSDWARKPPPTIALEPAKEAEVMLQAGNMEAQAGRHAVALRRYERCLVVAPDSEPCQYNGGLAAFFTGDNRRAVALWLRAKASHPDLRVRAKLVQAYQRLGDKTARDRERRELIALHEKDAALAEQGSFCRDQFEIGERQVMAFESFLPAPVPDEGTLLHLHFMVGRGDEPEKNYLALFSQPGKAEPGKKASRTFLLGALSREDRFLAAYEGWTEEPPYEEVRGLVEGILGGTKRAARLADGIEDPYGPPAGEYRNEAAGVTLRFPGKPRAMPMKNPKVLSVMGGGSGAGTAALHYHADEAISDDAAKACGGEMLQSFHAAPGATWRPIRVGGADAAWAIALRNPVVPGTELAGELRVARRGRDVVTWMMVSPVPGDPAIARFLDSMAIAPPAPVAALVDGSRGFRLAPPAGWGHVFLLDGDPVLALADGKRNLRVMLKEISEGPRTGQLETFEASVKRGEPGYRRLSAVEAKVDGEPAYDYWYTVDRGGGRSVAGARFILLKEQLLGLIIEGPGDQIDPALKAVLESFRPPRP